ncbi:MAG: sugar ABC transporter permease [Clostridium sp.]|mgnify:CR=1 FL=1|uniref:carbohydrate ABC transporter permease n=1 Tax=Clostridium TaxID=1485 RepID=UPI0011582AA1|nr:MULTISPECIES: sugar ABC transporter permease [Clostridium]MBS5884439.1 sugar ABC transporter permease [Clostridium sp.]MDU7147757.1 sugar ABC transporter permease [Clostridium sp.]MDU7241648.1 sugar ABC transporter permease [Clostridium sp.]
MFSRLDYKQQRRIIIFLFLVVPITFLLLFTYLPAINMIAYSFTSWKGYGTKTFVGLQNYIDIFSNPEIFGAFKNSIYYFVGGIIQLILAFYLAVLVNSKLRGKGFFKSIFFFPYLINGVAISLMFLFFFQPEGTLDTLMKMIGLEKYITLWLGNEDVVNYSLAFTSIWRYIGYSFIIFLGAMQSVSTEVLEAAEIDGAGEWHKIRYILVPSVKNIIKLNLILNISGAISVFEMPYIMTGGANGSSTFVIETMNTAFKFNQVGKASAMAVVVMFIVGTVALIQNIFFKEEK